MLQLAMFFLGASGAIGLFQIYIQKKSFLNPNLTKKLGESKSKLYGTILAVFLLSIGILGIFLPQILLSL